MNKIKKSLNDVFVSKFGYLRLYSLTLSSDWFYYFQSAQFKYVRIVFITKLDNKSVLIECFSSEPRSFTDFCAKNCFQMNGSWLRGFLTFKICFVQSFAIAKNRNSFYKTRNQNSDSKGSLHILSGGIITLLKTEVWKLKSFLEAHFQSESFKWFSIIKL